MANACSAWVICGRSWRRRTTPRRQRSACCETGARFRRRWNCRRGGRRLGTGSCSERIFSAVFAETVRACPGPFLLRGSINRAAAVFFCQAKRSAHGVDESGAISFFSWSPILFGGRQREAQQVGRAGEQAAAHSDAKGGALQYSHAARLAGGESGLDLRG